MIDPISAFAAANAAVKGIKQAIKFGQDVSEIGDKLQDFLSIVIVCRKLRKKKRVRIKIKT